MTKPVRILIVGTGSMAGYHAGHYQKIPGVELVAGVDVNAEQLAKFSETHGIPNKFATVEEAIAWGQFDAVSNVTPDRFHCATTLPLLAAGKHVLCEKPLATNATDAQQMVDAAVKAGVVNAVNLSYRSVASMHKAAELVRAGEIGEVRFFEACYLQDWLHSPNQGWQSNPAWLWRLSTGHGSKGALGDIGVHIIDFATHVAGLPAVDVSCRFAVYDKAPGNKVGEYTLDANDSATMQLSLSNGALGTISATRVATGHGNDLRLKIYGTKGALEVLSVEADSLRACFTASWREWQTIKCDPVPENYARFIASIRGENALKAPDFARGAEIQRILDTADASANQNGLTLKL